jgi:hypothetical protein
MKTRSAAARPRAARWLASALLAGFAGRAAAQPLPIDPEAQARAQRVADRVMEVIRNASKAEAPRPAAANHAETPPRPAARPAAPKPAPRPDAATRAAASGAASGASGTPDSASASAPATAASEVVTLEKVTIVADRMPSVLLFDFEESASGFALHARTNWAVLPAKHIGLAEQAQRGRQALAVQAPERAWLGVDLDDAVDFTDLGTISYWLLASPAAPPAFAIKTGTQYDWCRLTVTATQSAQTPSGTFVRYEADVKQASKVCRHVDLTDVRGFFWELEANVPVVLDNVELH